MWSVAFSPSEHTTLASGSGDRTIKLWRVTTGELLHTLTGHEESVWSVAFTADGQTLASGSAVWEAEIGEPSVRFWRVSDGSLLETFDEGTGTGVFSIANSPGGELFAYGRQDATLVVARNPFVSLPDNFSVARGLRVSGDLEDLLFSDDNHLAVRPWFVLTTQEAPVQVVVEGTARTDSPQELRFKLEAHTSIPTISQKIELFNYVTGTYGQVDLRTATVSDSITEVHISAKPERFIDPTTLVMKARLSYKEAGPILLYPWVARIDSVLWAVAP